MKSGSADSPTSSKSPSIFQSIYTLCLSLSNEIHLGCGQFQDLIVKNN